MDVSRQEYWGKLSFCCLEDFPDPGIKPGSSAFQANSLPAKPLKLNILANTALFVYKRNIGFYR